MKKVLIAVTVAAATTAATADVIEAKAGGGIWMSEASGSMSYKSNDSFSLNDLGISKDSNYYLYAQLEHFVPLIPNIKLERHVFDESGSSVQSGKFGDTTYTNETVEAKLALNQNDITLYWGVPLLTPLTAGIVSVDFGLTAKNIEGSYAQIGSEKNSINTTIPMGYLAASVDVPMVDLEIEANTKYISYDSSTVQDSAVMLSYALPLPLPLLDIRVDAGYKMQSFDISSKLVDDTDIDADVDGFFVGLSAKF
ncbi:MAG: TIGR04219 family outer membrane beta-barrel protein [Campylobacterota bacterium]